MNNEEKILTLLEKHSVLLEQIVSKQASTEEWQRKTEEWQIKKAK